MRNVYSLALSSLHCKQAQVLQASSAAQLVANHAWSTIAWPLSDLAFSTGEAKSKLARPPPLKSQLVSLSTGLHLHLISAYPACLGSGNLGGNRREHFSLIAFKDNSPHRLFVYKGK